MIQEVTAYEYFMGEINRRRNGVSTSFHGTSIGSICLPRRWKNYRIRLGEGLCMVIQNRRELWKAMESQETPKGRKKSFSVHPWAPLPRWKVPVFSGLLSSRFCLLLLLFSPRRLLHLCFSHPTSTVPLLWKKRGNWVKFSSESWWLGDWHQSWSRSPRISQDESGFWNRSSAFSRAVCFS